MLGGRSSSRSVCTECSRIWRSRCAPRFRSMPACSANICESQQPSTLVHNTSSSDPFHQYTNQPVHKQYFRSFLHYVIFFRRHTGCLQKLQKIQTLTYEPTPRCAGCVDWFICEVIDATHLNTSLTMHDTLYFCFVNRTM